MSIHRLPESLKNTLSPRVLASTVFCPFTEKPQFYFISIDRNEPDGSCSAASENTEISECDENPSGSAHSSNMITSQADYGTVTDRGISSVHSEDHFSEHGQNNHRKDQSDSPSPGTTAEKFPPT